MDLETLEKLHKLKEKGLITQEEFEEQKKELLHPIQSQSEEQNVKKDSVKILKDLKDKGLKKLKEQNIPEKLNNLKDKGMEVAKDIYNKNKSTDTDWRKFFSTTKLGYLLFGLLVVYYSLQLVAILENVELFQEESFDDNKESFDDDSDVEIIQQYDCPNEFGYHRLCGIVENKSSTSEGVFIHVYYYDADGVKIGYGNARITIDPHGKSKFRTHAYTEDEPFDYYEVELQ